jgi:hypothetical protein
MHPLTCASIDLKLDLADEALVILLPAKPGPWR